jgi:S1-C subfamily serine protease
MRRIEMTRTKRIVAAPARAVALIALILASMPSASALPVDTFDSVVSVLPLWPGHVRGGSGNPLADAPEGAGVAIRSGGYIATAAHVVDKATDVRVRLADDRILPAEVIGTDSATDIAVLRVGVDLPVLPDAPPPGLGDPACAIGNQFGLDLSVTCGVVSAVHRAGTGFNVIEDFIQTDAAVNPGASGGALVDGQGRLLGMLSAIFANDSSGSIGVNFAVSLAMLHRVTDDLIDHGKVLRGRPGLRVAALDDATRERIAGVRIIGIVGGGAAARAGLRENDIVTRIDGRPVRSEPDVLGAVHLHRPGDEIRFDIVRDGEPQSLIVVLEP